MIAGKQYATFGIDAAFADALCEPPDTLQGGDYFSFIGIEPLQIRSYPIGAHLAEKLHAYTLPRATANSRVKDLPDIALLATSSGLLASTLREAIKTTFQFRNTHPIPANLPDPPDGWIGMYLRIAQENDLRWPDLAAVTVAAQSFLNPVLQGVSGEWDPHQWVWRETP